MTLQKVAKRAGVSVSTASKALSNAKDVSEDTKKLVKKAADELGYFSESKKRRLENRSASSPTVGIVCPEIISVHYSETVTALCRIIEARGGKASVFITNFDKSKLKTVLERCVSENEIAGVICLESAVETEAMSLPIPIVCLAHVSGDCVYTNMGSGIKKAIEYLMSMGHRKIGFAGEPLTISKEQIFREHMSALSGGYDEAHIFCEEGRFESSGRLAAQKIAELEEHRRPTAVIAAYDEVAYGLMYTLRANGIRVPEDISLIGINDIPTSRFLDTPLTTIRADTEYIAESAVEILLSRLLSKDAHADPRAVEAAAELVIRKSVAEIN